MTEAPQPRAGEVWDVPLDPVQGHEQGGFRPAIVISANWYNETPHGLCIIVPLSRSHKGVRAHLPVDPDAAGLNAPSYALGEQVRAVSATRLRRRRGTVSPDVLEQLREIVRMFLMD